MLQSICSIALIISKMDVNYIANYIAKSIFQDWFTDDKSIFGSYNCTYYILYTNCGSEIFISESYMCVIFISLKALKLYYTLFLQMC